MALVPKTAAEGVSEGAQVTELLLGRLLPYFYLVFTGVKVLRVLAKFFFQHFKYNGQANFRWKKLHWKNPGLSDKNIF